MSDLSQASQIKALHKERILAQQHVVGIGVGYKETKGRKTNEISLVVLVRRKLDQVQLAASAVVPREVDGLRTDVIQVGDLRPLLTRTERWRPAPGGVSLGHYQITAGTFGAVVRDRATGTRLILSNNHVLANSNNAQIGDAILQPGAYDGGTVAQDTIAHLERFCPIQFGTTPSTCSVASGYAAVGNAVGRLLGSHHHLAVTRIDAQAINQADAAVARPVDDTAITNEILEIGTVSGTSPAQLGMQVRKSGRTTAFTTGQIDVVDATVSVSYDAGRTATFEGQLVAGPMSQGGDSGSLVVAADSLTAVGLLFAGSDQTTIFNPIQAVLDCLLVDI
jgi:hypothetical protein